MSTPSLQAPQAAPATSVLQLAPRSNFRTGDDVKYYSATHSQWVDSKVVDVNEKGEIQVACKQGRWMTIEEQSTQIKLVGSRTLLDTCGLHSSSQCSTIVQAAAVKNGDKGFYYSDSNQCWCPCTVIATAISGEIQVDIKNGYWISLKEQEQKMAFGPEMPNQAPLGVSSTIPARSSFGMLCAENLAAHDSALGTNANGNRPASSVFAPSEFSVPRSSMSITSRPPTHLAMCTDSIPAFIPPSSTNSLRAEVGSVLDSSRTVPDAKEFNRIAFDPGVSVTAFKATLPPGSTFDRGHQYECNLDSAVHVPRSFSFGSTSSLASSLGSQSKLQPSTGYRHQSSLPAVLETQESPHIFGEGSTVIGSPMMSSMMVPSTTVSAVEGGALARIGSQTYSRPLPVSSMVVPSTTVSQVFAR